MLTNTEKLKYSFGNPIVLSHSSFVQFIKKPRQYTFNVQRSHYRRLQDTENMQLKKTVLFKKIPGTGKNLRIFWYYIQNQKLTAGKHSKSEKSSDLLYNFFEILMVGLRPTSNSQLVTEKSLVVTLIADSANYGLKMTSTRSETELEGRLRALRNRLTELFNMLNFV